MQGLPCFVFINRSVSTLFHVWKKNPNADFTPTVDFPEVFKFIERIQEENRWTFTFDKTAEIKEVLTLQLSIMLRELLERSRSNTLAPDIDYADESPEAQRLAREKPEYWEFFLTAELLKTKFAQVRTKFQRQQGGLLRLPSYILTGRQFLKWVPVKIQDFSSMAEAFESALPPIQEAWGPPGKPGDPRKIKEAVNQLVSYCDELLRWEQDLCAAAPPEPARGVRDSMKGWTETILLELEKLPIELTRPFEGGAKPKGTLQVMLTLQAPSFDKFYLEFQTLERHHAGEWLD